MNLKQAAQTYVPTECKDVSDLTKLPLDAEIYELTKENKEGKEYTAKFVKVEGVEYRVPAPVLGQIKLLMARLPELKAVQVFKEGSGKNSKYQTISKD